jgi:hypothetical protein
MILPLLHPRLDHIARLADGTLEPRARRRVGGHVGRCPRCQATLRFVRRLRDEAERLPTPPLPEGVLERALASRAAGERTILPLHAPGDVRRRRPVLVAATGAAAAAVALFALLTPQREGMASEAESVLTLSPAAPRVGERIAVSYRPANPALARAERLVLRARMRSPNGSGYGEGAFTRTVDTLVRADDGSFRGSVALPDSVVYAALAVEDVSAEIVDDRGGRAWDVVRHGADGRPLLAGLKQREEDFMGRSWEEAYATARRKAELYPGSIAVWSDLEFYERAVLGREAADSIAAVRRPRVDSMVQRYQGQREVPLGELSALVWRAHSARDSVAEAYWYGRLEAVDPHDPQVAQIAAVRLAGRYWKSAPAVLMDSLEILWRRVAPLHGPGSIVASIGEQLAVQQGDSAAYGRWIDRLPGMSPARSGSMLVRMEGTREEGMRRLRLALERPATADARPLSSTVAQFRRQVEEGRRRTLGTLGEALIAAGRVRPGLDTLALATAAGWDLPLLKRVAAQRLALGDTAGALPVQARIAVDPRTPAAEAARIARVGTRRMGAARWASTRAAARAAMIREVMAGAEVQAIRGAPRVQDAGGAWRPVRETIAGKPTLLVFWSRNCGYALEAAGRIDSVAARLRAAGVATYLVTDEAPSPALAQVLAEKKFTIPVLHDSRRELGGSLRNFGTPTYYVLDPAGRVRFDRVNEVDDLLLQFAALDASRSAAR